MILQAGAYTIESSNVCWTIYEHKSIVSGEKAGQIKKEPCGDHARLNTALAALFDFKLRDATQTLDVSTKEGVAAIRGMITMVHNDILELTKGMGEIRSARQDSNTVEGGMYSLPALILSIVPNLEVKERKQKGRGETIKVVIPADDVDEVVSTIKSKMSGTTGGLYAACKRTLQILA